MSIACQEIGPRLYAAAPSHGDGGLIALMAFVPIGFAATIAAALLLGIPQAQAGSLDDRVPSMSKAAKQAAGAGPEATAASSSPEINSIGAAVGLAAFLKPGVPVEVTRAALRRAWISDPAIRDFVGLSEDVLEPGR